MYALIDCNNFYASCQRVFRPELNGKPIVVLSNNDGCVIARSDEAKACGIPMGAAAFEYKDIFFKHQVHVFSANFELYGDMSSRVMQTLAQFACEQEIYSIDECFLKLQGYDYMDLKAYGKRMRQQVLNNTGLPVSVGIAPSKSLAKLAGRIAKKFPKESGGCHLLDSPEKIQKALKWLDIEDVWGIGRQHAKKLFSIGIDTAYQFTQLSDLWVQKHMSIVGLRLKRDLSGIPTLDLQEIEDKKNIASSRSFKDNIEDFDQLQERVSTFASVCAEKLRAQKSVCRSLSVFIKTNAFRADQKQYQNTITITLPYATNSSIELSQFASQALKKIFRKTYAYKKAGVMVGAILPDHSEQLTLHAQRDKRHDTLMQALDQINQRYGLHSVRLGCQGQKKWAMRQEMLSPSYTTKLDDIITIRL